MRNGERREAEQRKKDVHLRGSNFCWNPVLSLCLQNSWHRPEKELLGEVEAYPEMKE